MSTPTSHPHQADSRLDLVLERVVDVPRRLVWAAWTQPEHLKRWFTPAPWQTVEAEMDVRPGGTKYAATVIHGDEDACRQHAAMGFHHGWDATLDQLVALAKTM